MVLIPSVTQSHSCSYIRHSDGGRGCARHSCAAACVTESAAAMASAHATAVALPPHPDDPALTDATALVVALLDPEPGDSKMLGIDAY